MNAKMRQEDDTSNEDELAENDRKEVGGKSRT